MYLTKNKKVQFFLGWNNSACSGWMKDECPRRKGRDTDSDGESGEGSRNLKGLEKRGTSRYPFESLSFKLRQESKPDRPT